MHADNSIGIKLEGGKLASAKQIKQVSKTLMDVLQSNTDEETKRAALEFLKSSLKADGVSNCAFHNVSVALDNSVKVDGLEVREHESD